MSKNTSISLGHYFGEFIKNRINAGRYKNASEMIRAGLRLLEEEESKHAALKQADLYYQVLLNNYQCIGPLNHNKHIEQKPREY